MIRESNIRARRLLLSLLTPQQEIDFRKLRGFIVNGGTTDTRYLLAYSGSTNIFDGSFFYCILTAQRGGFFLPYEDQILAQKIIIEADEAHFIKTACASYYGNPDVEKRLKEG